LPDIPVHLYVRLCPSPQKKKLTKLGEEEEEKVIIIIIIIIIIIEQNASQNQ
jgi:hypothetical protein